MDLWEALVRFGPQLGPHQGLLCMGHQQLQAQLSNFGAAAQQAALPYEYTQQYQNYLAQLKREGWRQTVSQNWLNAMLDVEIGA